MANDLEEWRDLPMYEGRMQLSSHGQVRTRQRDGAWLLRKPNTCTRYLSVSCPLLAGEPRQRSIYIHKAVCMLWHGARPDYHVVRHLDGDCRNNQATNLIWGTVAQNVEDAIKHGRNARTLNGRSVLDERDVAVIKKLIAENINRSAIARAFGVSPTTIANIEHGKQWVGHDLRDSPACDNAIA